MARLEVLDNVRGWWRGGVEWVGKRRLRRVGVWPLMAEEVGFVGVGTKTDSVGDAGSDAVRPH